MCDSIIMALIHRGDFEKKRVLRGPELGSLFRQVKKSERERHL